MLLVIMELVCLSLKSGHCLLITQILAHSFCLDHTYYGMFYELVAMSLKLEHCLILTKIICIKYCNMPDAISKDL